MGKRLDVRAFETTFNDNFSNMIPYLNLDSEDKSPRRKTYLFLMVYW